MAWITGNGNSVGPGIMSTGRVWHWAQLIVTSGSFVAGALRSAHTEGGLRQARAGSDTPEHPGSPREPAPTRPNIPGHRASRLRHARTSRGPARAGSDTPEHPGSPREPAPTRPNIPGHRASRLRHART